jgi:hypothetical protein
MILFIFFLLAVVPFITAPNRMPADRQIAMSAPEGSFDNPHYISEADFLQLPRYTTTGYATFETRRGRTRAAVGQGVFVEGSYLGPWAILVRQAGPVYSEIRIAPSKTGSRFPSGPWFQNGERKILYIPGAGWLVIDGPLSVFFSEE